MSGVSSDAPWPARRGAILVVVLIFIAFVSSLLAVALHLSSSSARAAAAFAKAMRADELGQAAVTLAADQAGSGDPADKRAGAFVAEFAEAKLFVDYVSASARIDVNLAPPELLSALFRAAGLDPNKASSIADRITASRNNRVQGAATPTNKRIENLGALADAWGLSPDFVDILRPALTVANGTGKVDPTIANRLVIAALMGGEGERVDEFLERRRRGFTTDAEARAAFPPNVQPFIDFAPARAIRAVARIVLPGRFERHYEFIVAPRTRPDESVKTISWHLSPDQE